MNSRPRLSFYTRASCHLCDSAWYVVERVTRGRDVQIEKIDVDDDPLLAAKYGHDVPVVLINGVERFRHRVDADELMAALR